MSVLTAQASWSAQRSPTFFDQRKRGTASLGLALATLMLVTIVGTLAVGKIVAFATIPIYIIAILVLSVKEPSAALCVYFAYYAMEGMFKYLSSFNSAVYIIRPTLLLIVISGWLLNFYRRRRKVQIAPMSKTVALFLLWGLAQIFHPYCPSIISGLTTFLIWYGFPAMLMPLSFNVLETEAQEHRFRTALVLIATVVSLFAVFQFIMGNVWTQTHLPGYETMTSTDWWTTDADGKITYASFRPASTTAQGGGGGYWGHIGSLFALTLLAIPGVKGRVRLVLAGCLLMNVLGVMVCGVRLYVVLGIVEGALWLFLTARSTRELARNIGFGLIALLAVGGSFAVAQAISGGNLAGRYSSTLSNPLAKFQKDRGDNFEYLPLLISDYPLGISYQRGLGGKEDAGSDAVAANRETIFNAIANDMGVPGLILICILLVGIPIAGLRAQRKLKSLSLRPTGAMYLALLVGFVLMGLGGPSLQGADFYWLFAGTMCMLPIIERREEQERKEQAERKALLPPTPSRWQGRIKPALLGTGAPE